MQHRHPRYGYCQSKRLFVFRTYFGTSGIQVTNKNQNFSRASYTMVCAALKQSRKRKNHTVCSMWWWSHDCPMHSQWLLSVTVQWSSDQVSVFWPQDLGFYPTEIICLKAFGKFFTQWCLLLTASSSSDRAIIGGPVYKDRESSLSTVRAPFPSIRYLVPNKSELTDLTWVLASVAVSVTNLQDKSQKGVPPMQMAKTLNKWMNEWMNTTVMI